MASDHQTGEPSRDRAIRFWSPASVVYLLVMLIGLALGLFPGWIHPRRGGGDTARLPVLSTLAVVQAAYFLLIWPVVSLHRHLPGSGTYWSRSICLFLVLLLVSVPWWFCGAWLGSVSFSQALWTVAHVAGAGLLGLALGAWARRKRWGPGALLAGAMLTVGAAGLWYVAADILLLPGHETIWSAGVLTRLYTTGRASQGADSIWPILLWLALAAVLALAEWSLPNGRKSPPQPAQPNQNQAW